jgi:nitrous oxidase accessory protein NosD
MITSWHAIDGKEQRWLRADKGTSPYYGTPGTYKPSAATTGVPTDVTLTTYNGNMIITTPGTVLDSLDVFGFIQVRTANVTIRNCRVRGLGGGTNNTGLILATHSAVQNLVVQDCTLVPDTPSYWLDGIMGHDYTATRCNVYNLVDGFGGYNTYNPGGPINVYLYSNYVHDLSYFSPDPNHPSDNQTHNDCFQPQGGSNIRVIGNNFQAFYSTDPTVGTQNQPRPQANSAIQYNANVGTITDCWVTNNWFDGGGITVNVATPSTDIGRINNNQFGRNSYYQGSDGDTTYTVSMPSTTTCETIDNVYEDNGHAILVRHNG